MYSLKELTAEVDVIIDRLQSEDAPRIHPDWITQEVMGAHQGIEGEDCDFYLCTGRAAVRDAVRARLNRFKASPEVETDRQLVLEGYERLQRHYLVNEDETQVAVHIEMLSDDQLLQKASEYRAMGKGCFEHANEIDRYLNTRRVAA